MMKKKYLSPEFELTIFEFEAILEGLSVSKRESGNDDHNDDDNTEW